MDRAPLAHPDDSSASLLCYNRGQKDTEATSVVYPVPQAKLLPGTGPPDAGIMPHGGKSCQGQTAFRPALETPAHGAGDEILRRRPNQDRLGSPPQGQTKLHAKKGPASLFGIVARERRKTRAGRLTDQGSKD